MHRFATFLLGAWIGAAAAAPQDAPQAPVSELPPVVVSGEQPGPGLWKVSKGDHALWILGTLSPLPKNMTWRSDEVRRVIAGSQAILNPPRVRVKSDIGFFGKLRLAASLIGVRDNPHHEPLRSVVPSDLYARWLVLKDKYIGVGRGRNLETWRPIFAALDLYRAAIEKSGLTLSDVAGDVVNDAAKQAGIKTTTPTLKIALDDPHAAVKEFRSGSLDDLDCFRKTLDRIETDLGTMTARANAWATADLDALRRLPADTQREACLAAVTDTQLARDLGITDIQARVRGTWVDAAAAALDRNPVTFARLPIAELLDTDGIAAMLAARGYTVESPDAVDADADAAP